MAVKNVLKNEPKQQRYVSINKVARFKELGWKEIEITDERMKKTINRNNDLVLMEK